MAPGALEVRVEDARPAARRRGLALLDQCFEERGTAAALQAVEKQHAIGTSVAPPYTSMASMSGRACQSMPRREGPQRHESDERCPVRSARPAGRAPRYDGAVRAENESPALTRHEAPT